MVIPLAIIAWLLSSIDPIQWRELSSRPKHWGLISLAFAIELFAVCLTFVRWYLLVNAIGISFSLPQAFRLSFLSYLLNFVSAGSVGGDLFKAFFIAREQPGRKTEAVATIVVDRLIGLYAVLVLASAAILLTRVETSSPAYQAITQLTLWATALGGIGISFMLMPGFASGPITRRLGSLPRIGEPFRRLVFSVRIYRDRWPLMTGIFVMSVAIHAIASAALYLVARSLFGTSPSLGDHFVIVPLSMAAGALPLTPSGLGSFEFAMDELYQLVPTTVHEHVSGILVALVYRLVTIAIAGVGIVYYWTSRRNVQEVLQSVASGEEPIQSPTSG